MAESLDSKEMILFEEVLMGEVITNQENINLLIAKRIVTKDEVLAEMDLVRQG